MAAAGGDIVRHTLVKAVRHSDGQVLIRGRAIAYRLFRVPRRKHIQLLAAGDGRMHMRAPHRCTRAQAEAVLVQHGGWALKALERVQIALRRRPSFRDGCELPFLDARLRLRLLESPQREVRRVGRELRVTGPDLGVERVRSTLDAWYRAEARAEFGGQLERLGALLGVSPGRLSIRAQKARWGSCSWRGDISLNWRLMLLPQPLSEYVTIHELCHLRHLNHSRAFWDMVATQVPDWRERRDQLRAYEPSLLF
ncbi:MAG: SprT family zinc-dependent metalloprotease [Gammaproteobacteria bacterium]|nr:SprT family zinc-dependent metalloprotease [Gammaproteobacteria bacterium]